MPEFKTLLEALQYWSRTLGDAPAFIFRDSRHGRHVLTWNKLYTLSGRFAAILRERAVSRGHLVVNTLTNSPERVVSELAILLSGAASVNGQCHLADGSDLLRTLRVSRAAAILVDPDVPDSPWHVLKHHVTVDDDDSVTSESLPDLRKAVFVRRVEVKGQEDFLAHLETRTEWFQADDVTPDDTVTVFTTSGTTGFSKLVVYTHGQFLNIWNLEGSMADTVVLPGEKFFSTAPLGWIGGYVGLTVLQGATRVLCDVRAGGAPRDMPGFIWRSLQEEHCRRASFAPMLLTRLIELSGTHQLENKTKQFAQQNTTSKTQEEHKRVISNASRLSAAKQTHSKIRCGENEEGKQEDGNGDSIPLTEDSGCTRETKQHTRNFDAVHSHGDDGNSTPLPARPLTPNPRPLTCTLLGGLPVTHSMVQSALSISQSALVMYVATDFGFVSGMVLRDWTDYVDHDTGPPLTNVQVKIVSQQDEDIQLPADQLGLVLVKRPVFPGGYLNDPEASAAILTSDGFIRTGDVGRLDQRGHLIVEGRGSDAIMRGLYIFYPAWLEKRIGACPGVCDVIIVGVPDPGVNEELCACVVLESDDVTMKEVQEFVERDIVAKEDDPLSPRPRYYLRFESFPETSTAKVSRKATREQAAQMLGLSSHG
ncbi:3-[(3aS,4S,7aS)-7a-methyl-1,5-dioxo-octahydro-1H-inden-4-yl]propanoyl:CoA ligase-like [Littorina saxatilis]|uniref:Uncharacterized protein n=1 Tax=Littorina saxatilis TaxID=31220 RepID=A0AAN9GEQ3_9CAEN